MNNTNDYNLIDEPWIPVLMNSGKNETVSLGAIFADTGGEIADLALNPYERVAVFRLLLCIAQAALGPERLKDEQDWLSAKKDVGSLSKEYLEKWHDRFFLYGPHAFLQPDCIKLAKADSATPRDKLILRLSSGNKSTLYDHAAVSSRNLSHESLVLGFLVYQNFSAGGLSGQCIWDGISTEKIIQGAPCRERSMLFTIIQGYCLLETIWLNLLTDVWIRNSLKTEWGHPFWEMDELSRTATSGNEKTYLGHLVPFSRAIKLAQGVPVCTLGGALSYPQFPTWREPMASVKLSKGSKKEEFTETYVASNPARMPWRELSSILAIHESNGHKSALSLRHLESLDNMDSFMLWTGGLFSDKAKEISTVEWTAQLSVSILDDSSMQLYEKAISWANRQYASLNSAVIEYARFMLIDDAARFSSPAGQIYWDLLAEPTNQKSVIAVNSVTYLADWKKVAYEAAEEAYRRACPTVTARQMEAYAQGLSKLNVHEED